MLIRMTIQPRAGYLVEIIQDGVMLVDGRSASDDGPRQSMELAAKRAIDELHALADEAERELIKNGVLKNQP